MQHLGETAQNGVFWGQEIVTLSAARVRIWGGPENLKEEEAKAESQRLFREILRWSVYFRRKRYNDWWCGKYIHKYKSANLEDPHGYVWLLYKVHKHDPQANVFPKDQFAQTVVALHIT